MAPGLQPEWTAEHLSLGTYPDTGLSLARKKADEARKLVSAGTDPSDVRKEARDELALNRAAKQRISDGLPPINSFEAVAREWHTKNAPTWALSHSSKIIRRLEQDVFPWIGSKPVNAIRPTELLTLLKRVEDRGAIEATHRVQQNCVRPAPDEAREVERRQGAALPVLGDLGIGIGRRCSNDDGNVQQPCPLRCSQPHGTEVDSMLARYVRGMHDDRLKNAVLPEVLGEFAEQSFWEFGARVVGVFVQALDGDHERFSDTDIECLGGRPSL